MPRRTWSRTKTDFKKFPIQVSVEVGSVPVKLGQKGVVFEFETLLEMTMQPEIGIELTRIMAEVCDEHRARHGINSAIRLTPNDAQLRFASPSLARETTA